MRRLPALLALALLAAAEDSNLLPNGTFDKEEEGWIFFQLGGNGDAREIDKKALHVTKAVKSPDRPAMIWTDYALDPSQEGKLAFSIRAKGKKLGRAQILFIVWDADGEAAVEEKVLDGDLGAKWQTFEKTIEIPGPAKGGRILIRLFEDGELWLDDASVSLEGTPQAPREPGGKLAVENGDFAKSKDGWTALPECEGLQISVEKQDLRLSRGGHRLYPEQGVQQLVKFKGGKGVTLRCKARAEGAKACVALLAETADGALVAYARAEPQGEAALKLQLPAGARQLRVVLAIRGPGDAWFDDVRLE